MDNKRIEGKKKKNKSIKIILLLFIITSIITTSLLSIYEPFKKIDNDGNIDIETVDPMNPIIDVPTMKRSIAWPTLDPNLFERDFISYNGDINMNKFEDDFNNAMIDGVAGTIGESAEIYSVFTPGLEPIRTIKVECYSSRFVTYYGEEYQIENPNMTYYFNIKDNSIV